MFFVEVMSTTQQQYVCTLTLGLLTGFYPGALFNH